MSDYRGPLARNPAPPPGQWPLLPPGPGTTPPPLALPEPAPPQAGVSLTKPVVECAEAKKARLAREQAVYCNVTPLTVDIKDHNGRKTTFTAARNMRGDPLAENVPDRLRGPLRDYDLVIETISTEHGRGMGSAQVRKFNDLTNRQDKGSLSRSSPVQTEFAKVKAAWGPQCAKPEHQSLRVREGTLLRGIDTQHTTWPGAADEHPLFSLAPTKNDSIWNLFRNLLADEEPRVATYEWVAHSCAAPPKGAGNHELKALIRVHPKGVNGIMLVGASPYNSLAGESKWDSSSEADKQRKGLEKAIADATFDEAKPKGASNKPKSSPAYAAELKAWKDRRAAVDRQRGQANADLKTFQNKSFLGKSGLPKGPWKFELPEVDARLIRDDREIGWKELKAIYDLLKKAQSVSDDLSGALAFLTSLNPAPIQPKMTVTLKAFIGELTFARAAFVRPRGERYQAVDREWYLRFVGTFFSAEGQFSAVAGKMVLGTGIEATFTLTFGGKLMVEVEKVFVDDPALTTRLKGELAITAAAEARATAAYYEIASVSMEAKIKFTVQSDLILDSEFRPQPIDWKIDPFTLTANYRAQDAGVEKTAVIYKAESVSGKWFKGA